MNKEIINFINEYFGLSINDLKEVKFSIKDKNILVITKDTKKEFKFMNIEMIYKDIIEYLSSIYIPIPINKLNIKSLFCSTESSTRLPALHCITEDSEYLILGDKKIKFAIKL